MNIEVFRAAIRRLLPFVIVGALAFPAIASVLVRPSEPMYRATAVLLIAPPKNPAGTYTFIDPDRYVESQLGTLRSQELANRVSRQVRSVQAAEARKLVSFLHQPGSDLVEVVALTEAPALGVDLANTYAEEYLTHVTAELEGDRAETLADLDRRLKVVRAALRKADERLIVDPDSIEAQTEQRLRSTEYEELTRARSGVEFRDRGTLASQLIDRAEGGTLAPRSSSRMVWIASAFAGALFGALVGLLVRRLSPKSAGASSLEQQFGPAAATIVDLAGFPRRLDDLVRWNDPLHDDAVRSVAIRVEGSFPLSPTLTVAVLGTISGAGMSSLATSLAASLARPDAEVILVDADDIGQRVTNDFRALDGLGIGEELADRSVTDLADRLTPTSIAGLAVLGGGAPTFSRANLAELVAAARNSAHVVVFDCAPVFDSPVSLQLCRMCDVIVLGIQRQRTRASVLREVTSQFADAKVVPVRSLLDGKHVIEPMPPQATTTVRRRRPVGDAPLLQGATEDNNSSLIG